MCIEIKCNCKNQIHNFSFYSVYACTHTSSVSVSSVISSILDWWTESLFPLCPYHKFCGIRAVFLAYSRLDNTHCCTCVYDKWLPISFYVVKRLLTSFYVIKRFILSYPQAACLRLYLVSCQGFPMPVLMYIFLIPTSFFLHLLSTVFRRVFRLRTSLCRLC